MIQLILLAVGIATGLWILLCLIGINKLEEDYLTDYETLKNMVFHYPITEQNYFKIKVKFLNIRKYACANNEKLNVLERTFYERFIKYVKLKKQT